jgi:sigma-E factor negative regulatory protein RseA
METEVNSSIGEQLSAFLDGELPEAELQLLLRRLERDQACRDKLARYSTIGSILRKDPLLLSHSDLLPGLRDAISNDAKVPASPANPANQGKVAGYSLRSRVGTLAAAVLGAVVVAGIYEFSQGRPEVLNDSAGYQLATVSPQYTPEVSRDTARIQARGQRKQVNRDRMTSYLVSHGEFSRGLQGPMVDSRIFVQQASFEE